MRYVLPKGTTVIQVYMNVIHIIFKGSKIFEVKDVHNIITQVTDNIKVKYYGQQDKP